ncbi:MAG: hypothetical protein KDA61_09485 [Planctomycetales bacterium]|nr:hypothetical protein [Planctomycetales bacterium]
MRSSDDETAEFPLHIPAGAAKWRPNPLRAHGAWVYLFASIASGALVGVERGVEPAMLAGTAYAGAFLLVAALDSGMHGKLKRAILGAAVALGSAALALTWGASPDFFYVAAIATLPAAAAVALAKWRGVLSTATLLSGIATLTLSAPVAAIAGGADYLQSAALFALLFPFFSWRAARIAVPLRHGKGWNRDALRARGLREAAIAACWSLLVTFALRVA